jgi:hypothetical protein
VSTRRRSASASARRSGSKDQIETFIRRKQPGEVDSPELQRSRADPSHRARAAAKFSGVKEENIHFLDMPFYETGRVRKKPLSEEDIKITMALLETSSPTRFTRPATCPIRTAHTASVSLRSSKLRGG